MKEDEKERMSAIEMTLDARMVYIFLWVYTLIIFGLIAGYSVLPDLVKNDVSPILTTTYLTIVTGYVGNKGVLRWKGAKHLYEDRRKGQFWVYICWLTILALTGLQQFDLVTKISSQLTEIELVISVLFFGGKWWQKYLQKKEANAQKKLH